MSAGSALHIAHAGALSRFVNDGLKPELLHRHGIELTSQAGGSVSLAHDIRDGVLRTDVFLSADTAVIEQLMGLANRHLARWFVTFAGNEVVLAYHARGRHGPGFQGAARGDLRWHEVLRHPGVRIRRGDPDTDPLAYYTLFVCDLAERTYGLAGFRAQVLGSDRNPDQLGPGIPQPNDEVDAAFMYRNVARDRRLPHIVLPEEINLGSPAHAAAYATASYRTSDTLEEFRGHPIAFGATVLADAAHPRHAETALAFLLSEDGQRLVEQFNLARRPIAAGGRVEAMPRTLLPFVTARFEVTL